MNITIYGCRTSPPGPLACPARQLADPSLPGLPGSAPASHGGCRQRSIRPARRPQLRSRLSSPDHHGGTRRTERMDRIRGIGEGPAHRRTAHAGDAAAARPRRPRRHCRGPIRRPNPTRRRDLRHPLRRCAGRERHGHKWVDFLDCRYRRRPTQAGRASGKSHWRPNLDRITAGDCVRPLRGSVSCCHARSALPLRSLLSFARPMLPPGRPSRRGRAPSCPEPVAWRGSGRAPNGRRYRIEACEGHRLPPRLATRRPGGHPAASRPGRPATPPH